MLFNGTEFQFGKVEDPGNSLARGKSSAPVSKDLNVLGAAGRPPRGLSGAGVLRHRGRSGKPPAEEREERQGLCGKVTFPEHLHKQLGHSQEARLEFGNQESFRFFLIQSGTAEGETGKAARRPCGVHPGPAAWFCGCPLRGAAHCKAGGWVPVGEGPHLPRPRSPAWSPPPVYNLCPLPRLPLSEPNKSLLHVILLKKERVTVFLFQFNSHRLNKSGVIFPHSYSFFYVYILQDLLLIPETTRSSVRREGRCRRAPWSCGAPWAGEGPTVPLLLASVGPREAEHFTSAKGSPGDAGGVPKDGQGRLAHGPPTGLGEAEMPLAAPNRLHESCRSHPGQLPWGHVVMPGASVGCHDWGVT